MILVVFATLNGAQTLEPMLKAMSLLQSPDGGWRMIAVDNGSTDETLAILRSHRELPLTVLSEERRGKNHALNRALRFLGAAAETAELVVFTDDDIIPHRDWLIRLQEAARGHPEAEFFGGGIDPVWPEPLPAWMMDLECRFGTLFAMTDAKEGPCPADRVWGPNMAVRGRIFRTGMRFDPRFGPNGTQSYPMGSEIDFTRRLERAGHRGYFAVDARVGHQVQAFQINEDWAYRRAYRAGLGYALQGFSARHRRTLAGVPVRLFGGFAKAAVLWSLAAVVARGKTRRLARFAISWHRGALAGAIANAFRQPAERLRPVRANPPVRRTRIGDPLPISRPRL